MMGIRYPEIGICGLSCRLCPNYQTASKSRCLGCKSGQRMAAGCPFITCAIKRKGIEFCWDCDESKTCEKWKAHREAGKKADSFKCYQKLEDDIKYIQRNGVQEFEKLQKDREKMLRDMISGYNEGRSKSYYCIAATLLEVGELKGILAEAKSRSVGQEIKEKSKMLHSLLDGIAEKKNYFLRLRK